MIQWQRKGLKWKTLPRNPLHLIPVGVRTILRLGGTVPHLISTLVDYINLVL